MLEVEHILHEAVLLHMAVVLLLHTVEVEHHKEAEDHNVVVVHEVEGIDYLLLYDDLEVDCVLYDRIDDDGLYDDLYLDHRIYHHCVVVVVVCDHHVEDLSDDGRNTKVEEVHQGGGGHL